MPSQTSSAVASATLRVRVEEQMSDDKIYEIPAEWKQRGFINDAKYQEMYERSIADPDKFWAEHGQAHHLDEAVHQGQEHLLRARQRLDQMVRGRHAQRRLQLHRPPSAQARQADRDHLGGRRSQGRQEDHLPGAARRGVPDGQHPAQPQRQEGRPRHHLHADDPRGVLRDARLRAHRRDPLGGVRRLLAGLARQPDRGLQVERRHHRRRGRARRPQDSAQGQHRRGDRQGRCGFRSTTSSW